MYNEKVYKKNIKTSKNRACILYTSKFLIKSIENQEILLYNLYVN